MRLMAKLYKAFFVMCDSIVVPTIWGARFLLPKDYSFAENRYLSLMLGLVEPQWRDYFDRYIVKSRCFLDIGAASDGYYTIRACKLNPRIKVVAVEPLPTEYRYLLLNISLNSCSDRVIPINAALGKEQGIIESLLIKEFVGGGLSFYYELDLLEVWEFACGSLKMEEA